jgi:hypothetical protein
MHVAKPTQQNDSVDTSKIADVWGKSRLTVFLLNVLPMTLGAVLILAGGGHLLDQQLGTEPWLFIAGLVASYPLVMVLLLKKVRSYAQSKMEELKKMD